MPSGFREERALLQNELDGFQIAVERRHQSEVLQENHEDVAAEKFLELLLVPL